MCNINTTDWNEPSGLHHMQEVSLSEIWNAWCFSASLNIGVVHWCCKQAFIPHKKEAVCEEIFVKSLMCHWADYFIHVALVWSSCEQFKVRKDMYSSWRPQETEWLNPWKIQVAFLLSEQRERRLNNFTMQIWICISLSPLRCLSASLSHSLLEPDHCLSPTFIHILINSF